MDKTVELYYESAYLKEFEATVISCEESKGGKYEIVLDKTAFFPEQGGQSSDVGTLTGADGKVIDVTYVSIDKANVIKHVADAPLEVGTTVQGAIDWNHRFSNMQQHTGEHIFSGIVNSRYGYDNVGFHLSDSEVTMDYNGVLTKENIREIELLVNQAIWENVEVLCEFPDAQRLNEINYRSKKELTGDVRIVTVKGYDVCACCAPHVLRTGEIGILKVTGLQNYKGGVRVNILCGKRALEYLNGQQQIVDELSAQFTTSSENIISAVKKLSSENISLKSDLSATKDKLIDYELKEISPAKENVFLIKDEGTDGNSMRKIANALAEEHKGFCGVFAGSDGAGYKFIVASGTDGKDTKEVLEALKEQFDAKGGGNAKMVQGSMASATSKDISACLESRFSD